jgi:voltage-gated sodium channel
MRQALIALLSSRRWEQAIIAIIVLNSIILGLETEPGIMAAYGPVLHIVDTVILGIFVIEIALRIFAFGPRFFRDPWSLFDFAVVAIALVPAAGPFQVLRVAAVMATNLFGDTFPDWFGHLGASLYTLFQVMTLESWSMGIVRPVMEAYPHAWMFFVPFILLSTYAVLNLFIGVIVSAMQEETEATATADRQTLHEDSALMLSEIRALREEVAALRKQIDRS